MVELKRARQRHSWRTEGRIARRACGRLEYSGGSLNTQTRLQLLCSVPGMDVDLEKS